MEKGEIPKFSHEQTEKMVDSAVFKIYTVTMGKKPLDIAQNWSA